MKYTAGEFKADALTGILNGFTFGLIYSFYSQPFQFKKEEIKLKYNSRPLLYYRSCSLRLALAFGILRCTFNALVKQQLGTGYQVAGMTATTLVVSGILL